MNYISMFLGHPQDYAEDYVFKVALIWGKILMPRQQVKENVQSNLQVLKSEDEKLWELWQTETCMVLKGFSQNTEREFTLKTGPGLAERSWRAFWVGFPGPLNILCGVSLIGMHPQVEILHTSISPGVRLYCRETNCNTKATEGATFSLHPD